MPPYHGQFDARGFPVIEICVVGRQESEKIMAVVDTGYSGFLSLTYSIAEEAKLKRRGVELGRMANGILTRYVEYEGVVVIGDTRIKAIIDVQQSGRALLGNAFLKEARLCFRCDPSHSLTELNYLAKV